MKKQEDTELMCTEVADLGERCQECRCTCGIHLVSCSRFTCSDCGHAGASTEHYGGCPKLRTQPAVPAQSAPIGPKCCDEWPECAHTLALYERWKRGEASEADIRRLHATEADFAKPAAPEQLTAEASAPIGEMRVCEDCEWDGCGGKGGGCGCKCHRPRAMYNRIDQLEAEIASPRSQVEATRLDRDARVKALDRALRLAWAFVPRNTYANEQIVAALAQSESAMEG